MIEQLYFPPRLPEHLQNQNDWWIGTRDPYCPQLVVVGGPSSEDLNKAYQGKSKITLNLESRTGDMDDEPNIQEGEVEVEIMGLYENSADCFSFLVRGKLPYVDSSLMWVWDYIPGLEAGADVLVED